jgi:hypothetical protein
MIPKKRNPITHISFSDLTMFFEFVTSILAVIIKIAVKTRTITINKSAY